MIIRLAAILALLAAPAAAQTGIYLNPAGIADENLEIGDAVFLEVWMENLPPTTGVGFGLKWSTGLLTYKGCRPGTYCIPSTLFIDDGVDGFATISIARGFAGGAGRSTAAI